MSAPASIVAPLRAQMGLSVLEFASFWGVSRKQVYRWEAGDTKAITVGVLPDLFAGLVEAPPEVLRLATGWRADQELRLRELGRLAAWCGGVRPVTGPGRETVLPGQLEIGGNVHGAAGGMPLYLGSSVTLQEQIIVDLLARANPHGFIAGGSGAGKTQTARRLLAGVRSHDVPVVVVDYEGEYASAAGALGLPVLDPVLGLGRPLNLLSLPPERDARLRAVAADELASVFASAWGLGDLQTTRARDALSELLQAGDKTHRDIVGMVEDDRVKARLSGLDRLWPDATASSPGVSALLAEGGVLDLSHVPASLRSGLVIVLFQLIARESKRWPTSGGVRVFVLIDEAHRIAVSGRTLRTDVEQTVREGRKRGLALWFASQAVGDLGAAVLGSVDTVILHRADLSASERRLLPDSPHLDQVPVLPPGRALLWRGRLGSDLVDVEQADLDGSEWDGVARLWDRAFRAREAQARSLKLEPAALRDFLDAPITVGAAPVGDGRSTDGRAWRSREVPGDSGGTWFEVEPRDRRKPRRRRMSGKDAARLSSTATGQPKEDPSEFATWEPSDPATAQDTVTAWRVLRGPLSDIRARVAQLRPRARALVTQHVDARSDRAAILKLLES